MEHKILLVDDDRDLLEMLCSIFRRAGYTELLTASSGQEALKVWREQQPALIVLDVMMPGMDGFEVPPIHIYVPVGRIQISSI